MTPDVAVVIPLKLVYTPVDDTVTAPLCTTSTSTIGSENASFPPPPKVPLIRYYHEVET